MTIPVFIGYDTREIVAWHVLAHSIISRSSEPVSIHPVGNTVTKRPIWWREKGQYDSTEFSNARFAVPALSGYEGWAVFMDCDMLCVADIADLWAQRDDRYSVMVVKHAHKPKERTKFLGAAQTVYPFKNWSSLMLFNCAHPDCRNLSPDYINSSPGLDLHGFGWTAPENVGEISGLWNVLTVGPGRHDVLHPDLPTATDRKPALLHYTRGGPWHGIRDWTSHLWDVELGRLLIDGNPKARLERALRGERLSTTAHYGDAPEAG